MANPTIAAANKASTPQGFNWHRLRKVIHLLCFLVFLALPFFNVMRFDIPRQRFYFAGFELWINEFGIVFFTLMFLMFLIVVSSMYYGRVYCGYLCPQMIFSEASLALESRLRKFVTKKFISWKPKGRELLARGLFYAVLAGASVVLSFIFIAYFVEPRDLLRRLLSLDLHTAAGVSGAAVALITFLDFTLVRLNFCTTVCPYGYLQGMLGDGNTLLVHYRDENHTCIECKKCVRVCPMGIDIRKSPFQLECVHCAECIDACDEVLGKLGKPGLIHYAWGEKGELLSESGGQPWYRRLGIRDAKRVIVLLVLAFYACGIFVALGMRRAVQVRVSPLRTSLYRVDEQGRVFNRFRFTLANRSSKPAEVVFSLQQLPEASLLIDRNPQPIGPGESRQGEFEVSVPSARKDLVTHFTILTGVSPGQSPDAIPMTFLSPPEKP
jgi:cytochrome c oxidase accessory protein FixG